MYLIKAHQLEDVPRLTIDNIALLIEMPSRGVTRARNSDDVPIVSPEAPASISEVTVSVSAPVPHAFIEFGTPDSQSQ